VSQLIETFSPHALILDMDGLMVDSEPLWFRVERDFVAERGGEWTHALWERCIGRGTPFTLRVMGEVFGFPVDVARDTATQAEIRAGIPEGATLVALGVHKLDAGQKVKTVAELGL